MMARFVIRKKKSGLAPNPRKITTALQWIEKGAFPLEKQLPRTAR